MSPCGTQFRGVTQAHVRRLSRAKSRGRTDPRALDEEARGLSVHGGRYSHVGEDQEPPQAARFLAVSAA
jgi:hypothetical protein